MITPPLYKDVAKSSKLVETNHVNEEDFMNAVVLCKNLSCVTKTCGWNCLVPRWPNLHCRVPSVKTNKVLYFNIVFSVNIPVALLKMAKF